jgi:hypothetical protein
MGSYKMAQYFNSEFSGEGVRKIKVKMKKKK